MAVLYADGFDHYGTGGTGTTNMLKRNYAAAAGNGPQTSVKRSGACAWHGGDTGGYGVRIALSAPQDVLGVAMAFRITNLPSSEGAGDFNPACIIQRVSDTFNNQMCALTVATTGAIRVRQDDGTVIFSSAAGVITAGGFNHIEAKYTFANGDGALEVRVNEVTVIDIDDIDIGAPATAEQVGWADPAGDNGFTNMYVDDLVIWNDQGTVNNDFLGDVSVLCHMPNADTAQADWTKSTGTDGYVIIDDIPADADFLAATVVGDRSDFEMPTFSVGNVASVKAVQRFSLVRKDGAGTATFQQGVVSNAVDGDGVVHSPSTSEGYFNDVFDLNPDGSVAWDVPAVEDMQIYILKES